MNKGIYVHIPFCVKKCLYCDFCSTADRSKQTEYVNELIKDIVKQRGVCADTVFVGGGTPTVLQSDLTKIVKEIKNNFVLADDCEFTVEANPGTVDLEFLRELHDAGVNRLSIGVQSFNDNELEALGRIHKAEDAKRAFYDARKAGFDNINLDIMLSTPHQTAESVKNTLEIVKKLDPEHISAYSLIVEEGTPFYDAVLDLPDEDTEREIYHYTVDFLKKAGFERYEISNFAKKGFESRHNIKYWTGREYLGFGCAASSYAGNYRFTNTDSIDKYLKGTREVEREYTDEEERLRERFWLGLRMSRGVKYEGEFADSVKKLEDEGLLEEKDGYLRLTELGFDLGNLVFTEFV